MTAVPVRVLVVEDNETLRRGICRALSERYEQVDGIADGLGAVERIERAGDPYHVVVSDVRLPGADGLSVLRSALTRDRHTQVILMTAYGSIETAVEAVRAGALDFVQKPLELHQIEGGVARAVELRLGAPAGASAPAPASDAGAEVVCESPAMRDAVELAARVAPTRSTVLVTGETGTGKEVIAGLVHRLSPRAAGPLVKVNCAALPETLLESELFGHERGAFTGADRQRVGRFEQASGGTLFLDEVGDMSPATQAKLLRVLQEQEFHRLGGTRMLRTDARIVAATNQELSHRIRSGDFREDLYFRLNVIRIHLPPLREREEDLVVLARRFLDEAGRELARPARELADDALAHLRAQSWPGNVRELRNTIERAVLLCEAPRVRASDFVALEARSESWRPDLPAGGLDLQQAERELVLTALRRARWVQKDAAELLGVSRRKLNYMVQRMGIGHPSWRRNRGGPEESPAP